MGLMSVAKQRELGVQVHSVIKVATQVDRMLAFISQSTEYRSWDVMLQLYNTFVRPHWSTMYSSGCPAMGNV